MFVIYWPVCDVYIAHTTIYPEVSISLTEMSFFILQVNFHTSNDFCDWRLLNTVSIPSLPYCGVLACEKPYFIISIPYNIHRKFNGSGSIQELPPYKRSFHSL